MADSNDRWADQSAPTAPLRGNDLVAPLRDELQRVKADRDLAWEKAQAVATENAELAARLRAVYEENQTLHEQLAALCASLQPRLEALQELVHAATPEESSEGEATLPGSSPAAKKGDPFTPRPTVQDVGAPGLAFSPPPVPAPSTSAPAAGSSVAAASPRFPPYVEALSDFEEGTIEVTQRPSPTQVESDAMRAPAGFPSDSSPGTDPDL